MSSDARQVDAWLTHLAAAGHPATTIHAWRTPLRRAAAELPHGLQATTDELEHWLASLGLAANTISSYRTALRRFYRWAARTGRADHDPGAELAPGHATKGIPRPVPLEQLRTVLTHARAPYRGWMLVAAHAGLRACEVAWLDRADVTERELQVRGKGGRRRIVPTHPSVWALLADYPPGPVAASATPQRVSHGINRECDRLAARLDWPELAGVTAHRLRHTAATIWYQHTGDIRLVQQLLGHASSATTEVYAQVRDDALRATVLAMPALT